MIPAHLSDARQRPTEADRFEPHPGWPIHLQKYLNYFRNTGFTEDSKYGFRPSAFRRDWEPIGDRLLEDLEEANLIVRDDYRLIWLVRYLGVRNVKITTVKPDERFHPMLPPRPF